MSKSLKLKRVHKLARDFLFSFVVSSALIVGMSPSAHQAAPIPVLSLFTGAPAPVTDVAKAPEIKSPSVGHSAPQPSTHQFSLSVPPLSTSDMALISTVLAVMFSAMMTFNLALLRHLRRVNASSRRGAWKEG